MFMSPDRNKTVYVVGHTTPDTDSVCSSIAYAYFKNVTDKRYLFTPVRAGKLNHETAFVLEKFGVPPSAEIDSLVATVNDLNLKRPIAVGVRDSVQALAQLMREQGVRSVPVVDDGGRLAGVVGLKYCHHMAAVISSAHRADILLKTLGPVISKPAVARPAGADRAWRAPC
jgi:manganese-dependent inorganic pyrophosphatase